MILKLLFSLLTFMQNCSLIILLNEYLKQKYPQQYENFIISASYKLIYLYSQGQIIYEKGFCKIKLFINANPRLKNLVDNIYIKNVIQNEISQIINGTIITKKYNNTTEELYFDNDNNDDINKNCIYIFSDNENASETNCVNKIILHSQPFSINYEVSNVKLILIEIKMIDKTYKIDLKTDKYNYYIVDNILDIKFFIYFLNNYICNFKDDYDSININNLLVKIIDQNVNVHELEITSEKYIVIKKDNYITKYK